LLLTLWRTPTPLMAGKICTLRSATHELCQTPFLLIRRVAETCPDAVFVWVGNTDPNLRHWLDHELAGLGLEDRLVFPGSTQEMTGFYAAADVFVLTSREDPFPNLGIEALASGLQVFHV
jgi:glycosyltransferase involved in cell wall biosynthesis